MGEIVDVRPDRFLHALRDTGDWGQACQAAGLSVAEAESLCKENRRFDLAAIEAHMEWLEDRIMEQARAQIKQAREQHMKGFHLRHPKEETHDAS